MAVEFYDLDLKKKVFIDNSKLEKVTFESKSGPRYGVKGETSDGRKLVRFLSKDEWDKLILGATENDMPIPDEGDDFPR